MPTISDHECVLLAALQHTWNLCNHYLDQCHHLQLSQGTSSTVQLHTCHVPTEIQDIMADFRATREKSKVWLRTDLELLSSKSKIIKSRTFNRLLPRLSHFWLTWGFALFINFSRLFSTVKPPIEHFRQNLKERERFDWVIRVIQKGGKRQIERKESCLTSSSPNELS